MAKLEFKRLNEYVRTLDYYETCMLYGPLGTGKSLFCLQAGPDALYFDFDRGAKSGDTYDDEFTKTRKQTPVANCFDSDPLNPVKYQQAVDVVNDLVRDCKKDPSKAPSVIVIDSFTGFYKSCMAFILKAQGKINDNPKVGPTIQSWGLMFTEAEKFLDKLKGIPCPKVVIGHDMLLEIQTNDGVVVKTPLNCPGKVFPTMIAGLMDDVFYTKIVGSGRKAEYILSAEPTVAVSCRTRTNAFKEWKMNDGFWKFLDTLGYTNKK